MCEICKEVILRKTFYSDKDYLNCLAYIADLINSGKYILVDQTCPVDMVKSPDGCWVKDIIHHKIKCANCGDSFLAWADTYHGRGGFEKAD